MVDELKGIDHMFFGSPFRASFRPVPIFPIGALVEIGVDASYWVGHFAGCIDGVVFLTNAQLFANMGKPVDGIRPVVRIPIRMITFSSLLVEKRHEKDEKGE